MKYKELLIFFVGACAGASGTLLCTKLIKTIKGEDDVSISCDTVQDSDREDSDSSWAEDDRQRVLEFLRKTNDYVESSDLQSEDTSVETGGVVSSAINVVDDEAEELVSIGTVDILDQDKPFVYPNIATKVEKEGTVITYDPIDFAKAMATGAPVQNFIFNPMDQKLYWNFTYIEVKQDEIMRYVGFNVMNSIIEESNSNPGKTIRPRYLYNNLEKTFVLINPGVVVI